MEQDNGQNLSENISAKDVLNTTQEGDAEFGSVQESDVQDPNQEQEEIVASKEDAPSEESPKEEELFSSKFAALSRKEKALKRREKEIETRLQELESRLEQNKEPEVVEEPLDVRLKKNPLETLNELGLGYETLTQIALNDGQLTSDLQMRLLKEEMNNSMKSEIEALKKRLEEKEQTEAQQKHEQTINGFKNQIKEHINSDAENLELLAIQDNNQGVELVYDVIAEHYNEYEEVLDVKTAAELVENHLLEEAKKYINRNKIKKLMGASEEKETQESKPVNKKSSVTLSNDQSQTSSTGRRHMSDEEQLREAAKHIKWIE